MGLATKNVLASAPQSGSKLLRAVGRPWPIADALFAGILLAVAVARWSLVTKSGFPSGIDPGNWLAFGHAIAGEHIRAASIVYPPLVPLLELAASMAFGPFLGTQVLAEIASVVPAIAAYAILRNTGGPWRAAILANFLGAASSTYEAMAWGGYPQLIGLGLMLSYLWALDRFLRSERRIDSLIAGVALALTLATSDIIGAAAVIIGAVLVLLHVVVRPAGKINFPKLAIGLGLIVLVCAPLAPLYVQIGSSVAESFRVRAANTFLTTGDLAPAAATIYPDFPLFWRTAILLAIALPVALATFRRTTLWLLSSSLLFSTAILVVGLKEFRFLFLLPPMAVVALACWLDFFQGSGQRPIRWLGRAASVLLLVSLGIQVVAGLGSLRTSLLPYYTFLNPGLASAIEWVRDQTPANAIVAVSPSRGNYPLGWWMEGLGRRRTLYASDLAWLNFADERARAREAAQIFNSRAPLEIVLARARQMGVGYVLVDKEWVGNNTWTQQGAALSPTFIIMDNESVLLLRVPQD